MAFHPPTTRSRERIMTIGYSGMGKSHDYYSIARMSVNTGSDARFYIIDTDVSVERHLTTDFKDVDAAGVVTSFDVEDWEELTSKIDMVMKVIRPQDWLMLDIISPTWDWAQAYFTEQVFKKSRVDYFLQMREQFTGDAKKDKVFDGWKDWPFITGIYKDDLQKPLLRCNGNLYVTSEVKKYASEGADEDTKMVFGPHGVMPVGQKRTAHNFQTILWKSQAKPGAYQITTLKDRGHELMQRKPVKDFAVDYLVQIAKWELV